MRHIEAGPPLDPAELGSLGHHDDDRCVTPVPPDAGLPRMKIPKRGTADRQFVYRDANGGVLGAVLRWEAKDGVAKEIRPATFWENSKGGAWRLKTWPGQRPLYGLDLLSKHPNAIVLLVEGEMAAEAVERGPLADAFKWASEAVVAVTWSGGTNAIAHADLSPLADRDVIIVPDNDAPGEKAAGELAEVLQNVGVRRLRRWKAPVEAPEKWDIADAVPDGLTPEGMVESVLKAPDIPVQHVVLSLPQFLAEYEAPEYLIDGILQRGYCYSLTGMTGAGKTAVALLIAVMVADRAGGQKLGPHDIEHGRVVYITKENPTDVRMRLIGMASQLNIELSTLDLFVIREIEDISKDLPRITREIEVSGPVALVIVDTSPSLFKGDDENSNKQMGDHARNMRKLCELPGRPVTVALCHPPKHPNNKTDLLPRGGGAYLAEVDGNLTLWGHDETV
jgi:hypothetical protein